MSRTALPTTYSAAAGLTAALALLAILLVAAPGAVAQTGFGPGAEVTTSDDTGKVVFVGTKPGDLIDRPPGVGADAPAAEAGIAYLEDHDDAFGLSGDRVFVDDVTPAPGGGSAVHLQQAIDGVPVLGGELIVNLTDANEIRSVSGEALPAKGLDTEPAVGVDRAKDAAIAAVADETDVPEGDLDAGEPKLQVYDPSLFGKAGGTIVAWSVQVYSPGHPEIVKQVLIDADSGEAAKIFELVHSALNRRICDSQNNRTATTDCTAAAAVLTEGGTYSGGVADVQPLYDFSGQTYTYYNSRWSRDSIDGAGMDMRSTVRFCDNATQPTPPNPPNTFTDRCPLRNAFFSPFTPATASQAFYGQGVGSDDIVAHEVTHGVTQFESALVYQTESGAINESLSDVFGEALDLGNGQGTDTAATRWQLGEDSSLGVLRDMEHPPNNAQPDRMTSSQWSNEAASGPDNGGVHTNSGVSNKAAFLLTDGQTFNTLTVIPIGLEKTVRIYYEAQVNLLTSGSDYGALANALRQACTNLVGTNGIVATDCIQVNNAVLATEMDVEATAPDTTIGSGPGQTEDPRPTWTFSSNRTGTTFECSIDQGTPNWAPCSNPAASHTPAADLAVGTYTFRVRGSVGSNTDPTPATRSVTVLPDTTIDSGPGETDDLTPTWTFSANQPGASFECSIDQGTPNWAPCSGSGSHTAAADLADGDYTFRVRASVGSSTDPTPATRDFTVSTADMELVSKSDSSDLVYNGDALTYTITARNNGAGQADNARVVDELPEGTAYRSSSIPCVEAPSRTLTCGLGNLADDEERTFTITVAIDRDLVRGDDVPMTITNTATGDSDRFDREPGNDEKQESTRVRGKADLRISKSAPRTVIDEQVFSYVLRIRNAGLVAARGSEVADVLPSGVDYLSAAGAGCSIRGRTVSCRLGEVAADGSRTVTLRVRAKTIGELVNRPNTARLTNSASVDTRTVDGDESNNSDTVDTTVRIAPCTITGTSGNDLLRGTSGDDVICGRSGADVINGKGGDDIIRGGEGNDILRGAGGDDRLEAGPGNDGVYEGGVDGGRGDDRIAGGPGRDLLSGGAGEDLLNSRDAVRANDISSGGPGSDSCPGDRGDRRMSC